MFFITAGYHRYFSHRSYQLGAVPAVPDGVRRHDGRAEGPAVVGRRTTATTTATPTPSTTSTRRMQGLLVEPRRLDPLRQVRRDPSTTRSRTSPSTPSCASSTSTTGSGRGRSASRATSIGGWSGLVVGFFASTVLLWHAHVLRQLARARVRPRALRHDRHEPELAVHRARSPAARAGTTTTTTTRRRRARASAGGRST